MALECKMKQGSLSEFHQENTLITANTFQQHKRDSTHGHHQMTNTESRLIIFFSAKNGEPLYNQQKQDRELTGSDHELLIAKFRLKLKKVGKTTRPFRYDLNQILRNIQWRRQIDSRD